MSDIANNLLRGTTPRRNVRTERNDRRQYRWRDPPMFGQYDNHSAGIDRRDRVTRANALSMITEMMLSEVHPSDAVDFLEDLENVCKGDGVSLPELLAENMSTGEVPPLMWEIQRCDWRNEPELLMFLTIRTLRTRVPWMIRTACQAVGDNELLQLLRETIEPDVSCNVIPSGQSSFQVSVTVRNLSERLQRRETYLVPDSKSEVKKRVSVEQRTVPIEWLVEGRAWSLELKEESVELTLLEGPPAAVAASLHIDLSDSEEGSSARECDMEFPSETVLLPISRAGQNSSVLKPSWRPADWGNTTTSVSFLLKVYISEMADVEDKPKEKPEEATSVPEAEDDDWVIEYEDAVPTPPDEGASGWVLASWSGKDKDLD